MKQKVILLVIPALTLIIFLSGIFLFIRHSQKVQRAKSLVMLDASIEEESYSLALRIADSLLANNPADKEVLQRIRNVETILRLKREEKEKAAREEMESLTSNLDNLTLRLNAMQYALDKAGSSSKGNDIKVNQAYFDDALIKYKNEQANELLQEVRASFRDSNYQDAQKLCEEVLKIDPDNALAHGYLGASYFEDNPQDEKNIETAFSHCFKAIEEEETCEVAQYTLARIYQYKHMVDHAADAYNKTLAINPDNFTAHYNLGKLMYDAGRYNEAKQAFMQALYVKKDFVPAYYYLSDILRMQGDYKLAKHQLDIILKIDPSFVKAYDMYGNILFSEGMYGNARTYYNDAFSYDRHYSYLQKIGDCYYNEKFYPDAAEMYMRAIDANVNISEEDRGNIIYCYKRRVACLIEAHRHQNLIKEMETALLRFPYLKDEIALLKGQVYEAQGKIKEAKQTYLDGIRNGGKPAENYLALGRCYLKEDNTKRAEDAFNEALSLDSHLYDAYIALSRLYISRDEINRGEEMLFTLLELDSSYGQSREVRELQNIINNVK